MWTFAFIFSPKRSVSTAFFRSFSTTGLVLWCRRPDTGRENQSYPDVVEHLVAMRPEKNP